MRRAEVVFLEALNAINGRLAGIDNRFVSMDKRFDRIDERLDTLIDAIAELRRDFDTHTHGE